MAVASQDAQELERVHEARLAPKRHGFRHEVAAVLPLERPVARNTPLIRLQRLCDKDQTIHHARLELRIGILPAAVFNEAEEPGIRLVVGPARMVAYAVRPGSAGNEARHIGNLAHLQEPIHAALDKRLAHLALGHQRRKPFAREHRAVFDRSPPTHCVGLEVGYLLRSGNLTHIVQHEAVCGYELTFYPRVHLLKYVFRRTSRIRFGKADRQGRNGRKHNHQMSHSPHPSLSLFQRTVLLFDPPDAGFAELNTLDERGYVGDVRRRAGCFSPPWRASQSRR